MPNIVLIIGSAPDAIKAVDINNTALTKIIAINNAWQVRQDWDYLIHPEDFPPENLPTSISQNQRIITAEEYVPIQNAFGGFVYAGGTMAFTAAYWALGALQPDILAFIGCDMIYPTTGTATHFYGTGSADPLRDDVTLQLLEAKSARLFYLAAQQKCLCVNLSTAQESRLVFPRLKLNEFSAKDECHYEYAFRKSDANFDEAYVSQATERERELAYYFESGRYWEHLDNISANELFALDRLWMKALVHPKPSNIATEIV